MEEFLFGPIFGLCLSEMQRRAAKTLRASCMRIDADVIRLAIGISCCHESQDGDIVQ